MSVNSSDSAYATQPRASDSKVYCGNAQGERSISTVGRKGAVHRRASATVPATSAAITSTSSASTQGADESVEPA